MIERRPIDNGSSGERSEERERSALRQSRVEQWRTAREGVHRYSAGTAVDSQGNSYEYPGGVRLWIGSELEVMDSCQKPWAVETVKRAFEALGSKQNVSVLERGFGIGLIAGEIMDHLRRSGGSYTVIELNEGVANFAETTWVKQQDRIDKARAKSVIGGRYNKSNGSGVTFEVIKGDAVEETEKMAASGRKFHIIISDTFPLIPEEMSVNDLLDLETLVKCLEPDGVFAFFGYHQGSQGGMNEKQRALVEAHFEEVTRTTVKGINPPPDYKYLNPPSGPVTELPVIICRKPRI